MPLDKLTGGGGRSGDSPGTASATTGGNGAKQPESLVPGFGVPAEEAKVLGFGTGQTKASADSGRGADRGRDDRSRRDWRSNRDDGSRNSDRRRSDDSDQERSEKIRRYAEGMLRQYDANKSGRLEKEEWSKMRGDPEAADTNKDGIITQEELAERLASYSRGRSRDSNSGDRGTSGRSSSESSGPPRRFLTAVERLPKDIPSWFTSSDRDLDGQVMMHEFSPTWSESKAAEFAKMDLNGDGVITPRECLQIEEEKKSSSSSDRRRGYGDR